VAPHDVGGFAAAVADLVAHRAAWRAFGAAAGRFARGERSLAAAAERLHAALAPLASRS
jgi:hypothetical protein